MYLPDELDLIGAFIDVFERDLAKTSAYREFDQTIPITRQQTLALVRLLRWAGDEIVQVRNDLGDTMLALRQAEEEITDLNARCFDAEEELEAHYAAESRSSLSDFYQGAWA